MKTIKMICTKTYEVVLVEMSTGYYRVVCEVLGKVETSDVMWDYKTASFVFDTKVQALEGN